MGSEMCIRDSLTSSHWYPACSDRMPEHNEPDSGSKSKTYQSIAVYDGSDPAYFKNWHAKVLSHYATWLNGEERAGHWKQHLVSDGCFIDMPSSELDDRYRKLFRPHLVSGGQVGPQHPEPQARRESLSPRAR